MKVDHPGRLLEGIRMKADVEVRRIGASYRNLQGALKTGVSRVAARRPRATGVLEVGERLIKAARIEGSGRDLTIADMIIRRTPARAEDIPTLIQTLFRELGLAKASVVAVFPRSKAIVRYISLPSTDEAEIEKMVDLQASRLVPFEKDEAVIDFQVVGTREDGFSEVMVVVAEESVVSQYVTWLRDAGLEPGSVRLDAECIQDFYALWQHELGSSEGENISLIDIDAASSSIEIIRRGKLAFTRSLPSGTSALFPDGGEDRQAIGRFLDQIIDTFASYQKTRKGHTISRIILTGSSLNEETMIRELGEKLSIPVHSLTSVGRSLLSGGAMRRTGTDLGETSLSSVIGAPTVTPTRRIDLSPQILKDERVRRYGRKQRVQLGLLVVSILAMALAVFAQRIHQMEAYLAELDREIEAVEPTAERIEAMHRQTAIVQRELEAEGSFLEPIAELYKLFPAQASVSVLNMEENGVVTVKGIAENMSQVFELVPKLEASPIFEGVTVKYVNQRNVGQASLIDFQVSMEAVRGESNPE